MNDDIRDPDAPSDDVWQPIRASLREVAVPADAREGAIAAALAEFDALRAVPVAAAAAAVAAGDIVSIDARRQRRYRWLTGAAAAVVVLAVGGIVAGTIGRSSDDSTNVAIEPASAPAADAANSADAGQLEAVPKAAAETGVMTATAETLAPGGGDTIAATESTAAAAATESTPPPTIGSIDGAASPDNAPPVDSPDQLAAFAADPPATTRAAPTTACLPPGVEVLGEVVYRQQQAIVVRAPTGQISAIDRLTCAVLITVDP